MKTSNAGLALIREFEGCYLTAYRCPAGVWTIGYGHTNLAGQPPEVVPGGRITKEEASAILIADLELHEKRVAQLVKVPLTQAQFDVLVSFDFNTGALGKSTLLKKLNRGDYGAVPGELMKWTRGGGRVLRGLVRRRGAEAAMWMAKAPSESEEPQGSFFIEPDAMPQAVDPPAGKPMSQSTTGWAATVQQAAGGGVLAVLWEKAQDGITPMIAAAGILVILSMLAALWIMRERAKRASEETA